MAPERKGDPNESLWMFADGGGDLNSGGDIVPERN